MLSALSPLNRPTSPATAPTAPALQGQDAARRIEMHFHGSPAEVIVCIRGEATMAAAQTIEFRLLRLAALRVPLVTLDLSELRFISSLAMGVLVVFRRGVVRCGGRVRLRPAFCAEVREALGRAGLLDLFEAAEPSPAVAAV